MLRIRRRIDEPPVRPHRSARTGIFLALVLAASCDSAHMFAPRDEIPRVQFDHDAPQPDVNGDYSLYIPPQNTNGGRVDWTSTGIAIPANVWVKVEVNGGVSISGNPIYMQYYCGGCVPYSGTTAGPFGLDRSELRVSLRVKHASGAVSGIGLARDADPMLATGFIRLQTAGVLEAMRNGIAGGGSCMFSRPPGYTLPGPCPFGTDYHEAPAYNLSGSQNISVESLRPMTVHADKEAVPPGTEVTFTADTELPVLAISWFFAPGDTTSTPRFQYGPFRACADGATSCKYKPATSGRMYANATFTSGVSMAAHSQVVRIDPNAGNLNVTADKSEVDAGEEVTFTASSTGGTLAVTQWSWQPQQGAASGVCAPAAVCKTPIASTGTMTVSGTVNGVAKTALVSVNVHQVQCNAEDITLVRAQGPNPEGSFTTGRHERTISMVAELSEDCHKYEAKWEVVDLPGDGVTSIVPPGIGTGTSVTWEIPDHPITRYPTHVRWSDRNALAYRVRAYFDDDRGVRHWTAPKELKQRLVDVLRQEYLEYDKPVPSADLFGVFQATHFDASELNTNTDYTIFLSTSIIRQKADAFRNNMVQAFSRARQPITGLSIESAYRHPIHHHQHVGATSTASQHLVGNAMDFWIHNLGVSREQAFKEMIVQARKNNVSGCFEPEDVVRGANSGGRLTHFHLDGRVATCPRDWQ